MAVITWKVKLDNNRFILDNKYKQLFGFCYERLIEVKIKHGIKTIGNKLVKASRFACY